MKSIALLASLAAASVLCLAGGCSQKDDDAPEDTGGTSTNGGTEGKGGDPAGDEGGKDTGTGGGGAGDTTTAGGDTGAAGADPGGSDTITSCSTGKLYLGDPLWTDPDDLKELPKDGQARLDDPPLRNEAMAVIGDKLFIETEFQIWSTDLSDADGKLTLVAGTEPSGFVNAGVSCEDTQFLVIRDMVATSQGKLVVVDYVGGAVIEISDPGGPNCKSEWVAGTHVKSADPGKDYPLGKGDVDGPGVDALFGGPAKDGAGIHKVTVDPEGNIYTWDEGTGKFKMIATDEDRTVSTIGLGDTDDNIMGLAFLKGKLYATGVDGTNDFLIEVDPAAYDEADPAANVSDVFRSRDHFEEVESGHQAITAQVYADGDALLISGQAGYVWRVGTDGKVLATLVGSGSFIDYEDGFDPLVPHPANEWQLVNTASNSNGGPWLAFGGGKLYWAAGLGLSKYTVQFSCP